MLADDHNFFRQITSDFFKDNCPDYAVIGDAPNGQILLDLMERNIPDIVILDLEMPVLDGHKTLLQIRARFPSVRTIILSTHYNEYYIAELVILGANGYLSKSCFGEDVVRTIDNVYKDGFYFNEKISKEVLFSLYDSNKLQYLVTDRIITEREIQVLKLICDGKQYKEVAEKLNVGIDTVKFHIKSIHKKTQIHSVAGLVKYAIRVGITTIN